MSFYEYKDLTGDVLEVSSNDRSGVNIQTDNGVPVYIPSEDATEVCRQILLAAGVEAVIVPGKLPEYVVNAEDGRVKPEEGINGPVWHLTADTTYMRNWALENLAAAQAIEDYRNSEEHATKVLQERRSALAAEVADDVRATYSTVANSTRGAIDKIIEMEDAK